MTDILAVCIESIREALDPDNDRDDLKISEFSHLENDLGIDSPDYLQIILLIKKKLAIPHEGDRKCALDRRVCTVADLRDYFEKNTVNPEQQLALA